MAIESLSKECFHNVPTLFGEGCTLLGRKKPLELMATAINILTYNDDPFLKCSSSWKMSSPFPEKHKVICNDVSILILQETLRP